MYRVHKSRQHLITPKAEMTFESDKEAYEMYNTYAGKVGLLVMLSHNPNGIWKTLMI